MNKSRWLLLPLALLLGCGGSTPKNDTPQPTEKQRPAETGSEPTSKGTSISPQELLGKMLATYAEAKAYSDEMQLFSSTVEQDQVLSSPVTASQMHLKYQRPDRVNLKAYHGQVICNGEQFVGLVDYLPDQVLQRAYSGPITSEEIYSQDPLLGDVLHARQPVVFGAEASTYSLQVPHLILPLLTADDPMQAITAEFSTLLAGRPGKPVSANREKLTVLEPAEFDGHICQRLKLPLSVRIAGEETQQDHTILWIDQDDYLLRRVELPIKRLLAQIDPAGNTLVDPKVTMDFFDAGIKPELPAAVFELPSVEDATVVYRMVDIQPPYPPSPRLGKTMPAFQLTTTEGETVQSKAWEDKLLVAALWTVELESSLRLLQQLPSVANAYAENPLVEVAAINVDSQEVSNDDLLAALQEYRIAPSLKIYRDSQREFREPFITDDKTEPPLPMLVILDRANRVQTVEVGYREDYAKELPEWIDQIRAGKKLYQLRLEEHQQRLREYDQMLLAARITNAPEESSQPAGEAPLESMTASPAWTNTKVFVPGNVFVFPQQDADARILVADSVRSVVELDAAGEVLARHELDLPEAAIFTTIRTAVDAQGKRWFAVSAPGQKQAFVFDEQWKKVLTHPAEPQVQEISDLELTDLDGDGKIELLLAHYGGAGVHRVNLSGERDWVQQQNLDEVFQMDVTEPNEQGQRKLLCVGPAGTIVMLDAQGNQSGELFLGRSASLPQGHLVEYIAAADLDGDNRKEYLALGTNSRRQRVAVGFDLNGKTLWTYSLPNDVYRQLIEPVSWGKLPLAPDGAWAVVAPDGSIHFLSASGELLDRFRQEGTLTGFGLWSDSQKYLAIITQMVDEERFSLKALELQAKQPETQQ